ncbi:MAG: hypothetical protein Q9195_004420 [Heterodermia aff. obscurata]
MLFNLPSRLVLLSSLPLLTDSLPFQPREAFVQRRAATYSVVAVDGSSGSAPSSSFAQQAAATTVIQSVDVTETITAPAQTVPPATETRLSTITVEKTQPAKTVDVTLPAATILKTISADSTSVSTVSISVVPDASTLTISYTPTLVTSTSSSTSSRETSTTVNTSTSSTFTSLSHSLASSISTTIPTPQPHPTAIIPVPVTPSPSVPTTVLPVQQSSSMQWHTTYPLWNATSATTSYQTAATAASTGGFWRAV